MFKERTKAPCPTCRADVHSSKIFQGTANASSASSLAAWERPELAKVIRWCLSQGLEAVLLSAAAQAWDPLNHVKVLTSWHLCPCQQSSCGPEQQSRRAQAAW